MEQKEDAELKMIRLSMGFIPGMKNISINNGDTKIISMQSDQYDYESYRYKTSRDAIGNLVDKLAEDPTTRTIPNNIKMYLQKIIEFIELDQHNSFEESYDKNYEPEDMHFTEVISNDDDDDDTNDYSNKKYKSSAATKKINAYERMMSSHRMISKSIEESTRRSGWK